MALTKVSNGKDKMTVTLFSPKGKRIRSRHVLKNYCSDFNLDIQDFGDIKFFYNAENLPKIKKPSAMALALERLRAKKRAKIQNEVRNEPEILNYRLQKVQEDKNETMDWSDDEIEREIPDSINGYPVIETKNFVTNSDVPILGQNGEFYWPKCSVEYFGVNRLKNSKFKVIINNKGQKEMQLDDPETEMFMEKYWKSKSIPQDDLIMTDSAVKQNGPIMSYKISEHCQIPEKYKLGSTLPKDLTYLLPKFPCNALTLVTPSCNANKPDPPSQISDEKYKILSKMHITLSGQSTIYGDINRRLEKPDYEPKKPIIVRPTGFSNVPFHRADYDLFRYDI